MSCTDHEDRLSVVGTRCGCLALAVDASFTSFSSHLSLRHFTLLLAPHCSGSSDSGILRSLSSLLAALGTAALYHPSTRRAEGRFG